MYNDLLMENLFHASVFCKYATLLVTLLWFWMVVGLLDDFSKAHSGYRVLLFHRKWSVNFTKQTTVLLILVNGFVTYETFYLSAFSSLWKPTPEQKEQSLLLHTGELSTWFDGLGHYICTFLTPYICRMSIVEAADRILVMDGGQIVEVITSVSICLLHNQPIVYFTFQKVSSIGWMSATDFVFCLSIFPSITLGLTSLSCKI